MIDLSGVSHHHCVEEIVDVLTAKTQNTDRGFFRVEVAYFLSKMASIMRASVSTKFQGEFPVNAYAMALASSGYGKGYSVNIMENEFLMPFRRRFMEDTFPMLSEKHLFEIAQKRAIRNVTDEAEEVEKAQKEFRNKGAYPFTFDSGTPPAVKQLREKLLLAGCGAISLQIDEIGSNLIKETEVLTLFLELFDQGLVKPKLVKNTSENVRSEDVEGKTPTNMLLFGTPSKLLDGSQTEDLFYSMLETGYARRCLFAHGQQNRKAHHEQTPEEIYQRLTQPNNKTAINKWANIFHGLADPVKFGWKVEVSDEVGVQALTYKIACEQASEAMKEHESIAKAEMEHRYFKALKLAGAYAFVDGSNEVEMDHLMSAILLVEESGQDFRSILSREKAYVKLARYIADIGTEVTHADLHEALPFYKSGQAARNEMMTLATAWGYKKHIIIKKSFIDGIEFYKGETLQETNLDEVTVSHSDNWAYKYLNEKAPFDQLYIMTQAEGVHWANHHFKMGHRAEENVVPGFDLISIDVDGGVRLETVHELLKDYRFLTYTTKRHTSEEHRFRLILPMNYRLELDQTEYKEFMNSVMAWLPFKTDESANQRSKKWESFQGGTHHYNDGQLLDVLDFIPKTSRNEAHKQQTKNLESLDNLERWFAQRISTGNRNNQMIKFALALVDSGMNLIDVNNQVLAFNAKLQDPMSDDEIANTIMVTVGKQYRQAA